MKIGSGKTISFLYILSYKDTRQTRTTEISISSNWELTSHIVYKSSVSLHPSQPVYLAGLDFNDPYNTIIHLHYIINTVFYKVSHISDRMLVFHPRLAWMQPNKQTMNYCSWDPIPQLRLVQNPASQLVPIRFLNQLIP